MVSRDKAGLEADLDSSRRLFLKSAAATGVVAGLGGIAAGQEAEEIELGGETAGWVGQAPSDIEGETNPTLELEEGQTYVVTWENLDGLQHDFVLLDSEERNSKAPRPWATRGDADPRVRGDRRDGGVLLLDPSELDARRHPVGRGRGRRRGR